MNQRDSTRCSNSASLGSKKQQTKKQMGRETNWLAAHLLEDSKAGCY